MMGLCVGFLLTLLTLSINACTTQQMARQFGGSATVKLPCGQHLVNASWKGDDLWLLTESAPNVETKSYTYQESASFGLFQGKITIVECR